MTEGDAALDLAHPSPAPKPLARVYGEPVNELPQDLYIPPEALEVFLETFEGPLDLHYRNGWIKLEIGLAKGKKQHDKREAEKDRDWQRDVE